MSETTVLTDGQIKDLFIRIWGAIPPAPIIGTDTEFARAIEQAVLQSPEVQALRKDADRYRFCRSQTSPAEIHIHGVELGLAGGDLDKVMDQEMEAWES